MSPYGPGVKLIHAYTLDSVFPQWASTVFHSHKHYECNQACLLKGLGECWHAGEAFWCVLVNSNAECVLIISVLLCVCVCMFIG